MIGLLLREFRLLADEMKDLAKQRRAVSQDDPVADALVHAASMLLERVDHVDHRFGTLTVEQVASLRGTTVNVITRWCREGRLQGAMQDTKGVWRIPRAARLLPTPSRVRAARRLAGNDED